MFSGYLDVARVGRHFLEKRLDRLPECFPPLAFIADGATMVEDIDRGENLDAPSRADRPPWLSVPPAAPGHLAGGDRFLERLSSLVGVYAQEGERLFLEP